MTDDLRSALSAGDTPAGVDVGLLRARAHRLRRRRMALATSTAAIVTALAVAVPVGLLRADPASPAAPASATLGCPYFMPDRPRNTGPGLGDALVPFRPERGLVCSYDGSPTENGELSGVARLTAAELRFLTGRLHRSTPEYCTSEGGSPFAVQVAGAGRVVTLRLEPYGCAIATNGTWSQYAPEDKEWLRRLQGRAASTSPCADWLGREPVAPAGSEPVAPAGSEPPGDTLLPEDTQRLLVCRYSAVGHRERRGKLIWNVALAGAEARRVVDELNASPPLRPGTACTRDAGPRLILHAVTPDGVVSAVADAGGCGVVDNGVRQVTNKALVRELAG
jgi:hypothetical protein